MARNKASHESKTIHPEVIDKVVKALLAYRKFVFTTRDVIEKHKKLVEDLKAKSAVRS